MRAKTASMGIQMGHISHLQSSTDRFGLSPWGAISALRPTQSAFNFLRQDCMGRCSGEHRNGSLLGVSGMAIYSCNLRSIGRTTHAPGTAGAHIRYIARDDAKPVLFAHAMPQDPVAARTFLDSSERRDRKNARVIDKIRIALPRELDESQRMEVVREFMAGLTGGRVPWYAAIHQTDKDAHNPHVHIAVRDRDLKTGRRVLRLSDNLRDRQKDDLPGPKAIDWVRERWEHHANRALERAGHDVRVDRRTLEAQGINREPQIHLGPQGQHIDKMIHRPESRVRPKGKRSNWKGDGWITDYPAIDDGKTRKERNLEIIDINLERASKSKDFETRVWAQFEKKQRQKDLALEKEIIANERERTLEERKTKQAFRKQLDALNQKKQADFKLARDWADQKFAPKREKQKARQEDEAKALESQQNKFLTRMFTKIDITGTLKRKQEKARNELAKGHRAEQRALDTEYRKEVQAKEQATQERLKPKYTQIKEKRKESLTELTSRHKETRKVEDVYLQERETEREKEAKKLEKTVADWKRIERRRGPGDDRDKDRDRDLDYGR